MLKIVRKEIVQTVDRYLNANWLRPETVAWDAHLAILMQPYLKKRYSNMLEIGVGNGINTFLMLKGALNENFDSFYNIKVKKLWKDKDIFNNASKNKTKKIIKKKPFKKFNLSIDHKINLINQSKLLGISKKYMVHNCNNIIVTKQKFDFIFSNMLYWLNNTISVIKNVSNLLEKEGTFIFTIPNKKFFDYCKSYKSNNEFWKKINMGRKKHIKFSAEKNNMLYKIKKMKKFSIIDVKSFLSKQTLKIWDVGLRPVAPQLIYMVNKIGDKKRLELKKKWCNKLKPLLIKLTEEEIKKSNNGGFDLYILKKYE